MFLRNCWYAAAWDHEVGRTPLARRLLDEPVALYRRRDGRPVALADRCRHRGLPLSLGTVEGDGIRCGYHGMTFDPTGACIRAPRRDAPPPAARVHRYPAIEKHRLIWVWMGDPARADDARLPDWWWMDHPDWKVVKGDPPLHVECDYRLVNDNLLDLSHLSFVHAGSIGTGAIADVPAETERGDEFVRMTRWILDSAPPPMYRTFGGFAGNVDRWQIVESAPPGHTDVFAGCAEAGGGAPDGDRSQGIEFHNANSVTPETAASTHYFYAHARRFAQDSETVDEIYRKGFRDVFLEDVEILAAQQASLAATAGRRMIDINVDGPGLALRRMLADRIAAENHPPPSSFTAPAARPRRPNP